MQTIEFNRTSNVFLNTGIIALEHYLNRYKEEQSLSDNELYFELQVHKLIVNSPKLLEILEEVYYVMGREVYDTVTSEQIKNAQNSIKCNLFYDATQDKFSLFLKSKVMDCLYCLQMDDLKIQSMKAISQQSPN
ncbi:hypothetical protein P1X15_13325 [Runella sp. MFBS21]|uniref:hypothetical protein n=1 Tax=Runella sp. MFBS21 TaxID=3034018 RepID=UPI0023F8DFBD|nr:hypothetical protein [Runella sp. MFBS21]MDF7818590.1 hypothetical protein [Runella sp. MFBS21]